MKRGASGLSLVVGVDKPSGITSHDVVSRTRRIFGEKRVGHAGTLDPLATGVLPVLIGPAARLNKHLTCDDKSYEACISFGTATDTDDSQGNITASAQVPARIWDASFAEGMLAETLGAHMQIPPVYSAVKVNGKRAYDAARKGQAVRLEARRIEIYQAQLLEIYGDGGDPVWKVRFRVSKGTYIRSLARDLGKAAGTLAHISALRRTTSGNLRIEDCVTLDTLADIGVDAALDVVKLLGYRFAFLGDMDAEKVRNGIRLDADEVHLCEYAYEGVSSDACCCTSAIMESDAAPEMGEMISLVSSNRLQAIYRYDAAARLYSPDCVFRTGVLRGSYC